jgi:CHAT domain-containing protein/tetratricopeptide (TPR) repeat protein
MSCHSNTVAIVACAAAILTGTAPAQQPTALELRADSHFTRPILRNQPDRSYITLPAGAFLHIEVLQDGTDIRATLRDPAGAIVAEVDGGFGAQGIETVLAIATQPGRYTLDISLFSRTQEKGDYSLAVRALRPATAQDRELLTADRHYLSGEQMRRKQTPEARRQAISEYQIAAQYFRHSGAAFRLGLTLTTMSLLQVQTGDYRGAATAAEEAANALQSTNHMHGEMIATNNHAAALELLGEPHRALQIYRRSLDLARRRADRFNEALRLNNIAALEQGLGNWPAALDYLEQALAMFRQLGDRRRQALVLQNTAVGYLTLGDFDSTIATLHTALPLFREAKDLRGEADTWLSLGAAHFLLNDFEKALDAYQQSLAARQALGEGARTASTHARISLVQAELRRYDAARQSIAQAMQLSEGTQDSRSRAKVLLDTARAWRLAGDTAASLAAAQLALAIFREIGDRTGEASALDSTAQALAGLGRLTEAQQQIEAALSVMEQTRGLASSPELRASYLATRQDSFGFYIDLLVRQSRDADQPQRAAAFQAAALEAAERARARSLLDMLAEAGADIRQGADPALLEQERTLSQLLNLKASRLMPLLSRGGPQVAGLQNEIRELETRYRDVQADIRQSSPRYAALTQPSPLTLTQIQQELLDPDTLLLEYALLNERSYLWAVTRESLLLWELPGRARIEAAVAEAASLLMARGVAVRGETPSARSQRIAAADAALPKALATLSGMLLQPAAAHLKGKRLLIVADGALQRLPFAALPLPGDAAAQLPLVAKHEIVMLPSASALSVLRAEQAGRPSAPKLLAVFADPVFGSATTGSRNATRILEHLNESTPAGGETATASLAIPPLPYTRQEAIEILKAAPSSGSNLSAMGYDANRAAALSPDLGRYRFLHFATHGYVDPDRPGLSALLLSMRDDRNQPVDGFLRANDIYNLRLSADLVVLSACQTGIGKEIRGEGLMSFTRAFLYAGAPRVVVSLWNVNDRATAGLMAAYYRKMLRQGKRPPAALREAQLELSKQRQWQSPYYWAAFVQHGEWR